MIVRVGYEWQNTFFFVRYASNVHEVRIRFRGANYSDVRAIISFIEDDLKDFCTGGLQIRPYQQETAKYGGPVSARSAELLFAADSRSVIAQWGSKPGITQAQLTIYVAMSFAMILRMMNGKSWWVSTRNGDWGGNSAVSQVEFARGKPWQDPILESKLGEFFSACSAELDQYRQSLEQYHNTDMERHIAVSSILHMRANRIFGPSADAEMLARSVLRRIAGDRRWCEHLEQIISMPHGAH